MNFILFFMYSNYENNFVSRLLIPIPVRMTGICQNVKGSCNLFIEPQLTIFLVLYNLLRVFKILTDDIGYQENSGSIVRC